MTGYVFRVLVIMLLCLSAALSVSSAASSASVSAASNVVRMGHVRYVPCMKPQILPIDYRTFPIDMPEWSEKTPNECVRNSCTLDNFFAAFHTANVMSNGQLLDELRAFANQSLPKLPANFPQIDFSPFSKFADCLVHCACTKIRRVKLTFIPLNSNGASKLSNWCLTSMATLIVLGVCMKCS